MAGSTYPVRHCAYEFTQATSERGRVVAKVHPRLEVPDDDQRLDWDHPLYKPLAGRVIFYAAKGGLALETLAWEAGQCIGYQEVFASSDQHQGAYVCLLTIAAPQAHAAARWAGGLCGLTPDVRKKRVYSDKRGRVL